MVLSDARIQEFRAGILRHYREEGRDFPWRRTADPWLILLSEIMLQQTRTETVLAKWPDWASAYPDPAALSSASLAEVIRRWKGLGYNRRALALRNAAGRILAEYGGEVPRSERDLLSLPGVGPYTARAVRVFAFGEPDLVLETNIRSVYLFYFFPDRTGVRDRELEPYISATLWREDPRTWYYALMDYGAALKRREPNPGRRGASYARQSPFEGSHRQVRAAILHVLAARGDLPPDRLLREVAAALGRRPDTGSDSVSDHAASENGTPSLEAALERAIGQLIAEGFLERGEGRISLRG